MEFFKEPSWGWLFIGIIFVVFLLFLQPWKWQVVKSKLFSLSKKPIDESKIHIDNNSGGINAGTITMAPNSQLANTIVNHDNKQEDCSNIILQLNKDISSYDNITRDVVSATIEERGTKIFQEKENKKEELGNAIIENAKFLSSRTRIEMTINSVSDVKRLVDAVNNQQKGGL